MATTIQDVNDEPVLHGPTDAPLWELTLGDFLDLQCERTGDRECLVIPWTNTRWTYQDLRSQSRYLARYLHSRNIRPGDRVGILAGNRAQYAAVFFACMYCGALLVILNNTYTAQEAEYALNFTECKLLFATPTIGRIDNTTMLRQLNQNIPSLQQIVLLADNLDNFVAYEQAITIGRRLPDGPIQETQHTLTALDTCNLQFTSGTTGHPKAAELTHHGLLNNARFIGDRMSLTSGDVLCCPPPLFHCFGLVLGLLAFMTHGAKTVYPSEVFDGPAVLQAITDEKCTAVHGVPAMFDTLFTIPRPSGFDCARLRTGIIAGAPVARHLMERLVNDFGMTQFTSSYGLTEASPTCFNAFIDDTIDRRLTTVGTLMPHASAKIVNRAGQTVPIGSRGELCISGYQLMAGYYKNPDKTAETMKRDDNGVLWLHTGDEAVFDSDGYCTITGRFKDIIIRGGENIWPLEIEETLVRHPCIERAIVVGLPHARYGEVVAAFVERGPSAKRPDNDSLREWTRATLGRHKAPAYIFWLGEDGVPSDVPITGSGKIKKVEMKRIGRDLLAAAARPMAKL